MKLCARCLLISRNDPVTETPSWSKYSSSDLEEINHERIYGGGKVVSPDTIIPCAGSKFYGKKLITKNQEAWCQMKRCDECIEKIINEPGTLILLHAE